MASKIKEDGTLKELDLTLVNTSPNMKCLPDPTSSHFRASQLDGSRRPNVLDLIRNAPPPQR